MSSPMNLEERLAVLELEPNDRGRIAARTRVSELVPPAPKRRRRLRGWLGAMVVAALFSLTPPGQSLAAAVGDLVGIGDEPSGGPQFANPGESRNDTVIAVGETPSGDPFELVASDPDQSNSEPPTWPGPQTDVTDVYANFPDAEPQSTLGQVLNAGVLRKLAEGTTIQPALGVVPGEQTVMVNAYATADIERLALVIGGQEVPMTSGVLEPYPADGSAAAVRYGIGFVPDGALDVSRLRELAAPLGDPVQRPPPAILDQHSPQAQEAMNLLSGIEVVGFDTDGGEIYRRHVSGSQDSALGVLVGLVGPPDMPEEPEGTR